jgi:hypothetical protein
MTEVSKVCFLSKAFVSVGLCSGKFKMFLAALHLKIFYCTDLLKSIFLQTGCF